MRRAPSIRLILVALVVSLGGSFHFGYQLVITNPAQSAFIRFVNDSLISELNIVASGSTLDKVWSFIVAVLFLGALAGSFSIRLVADKVGRKRGLYLSIGIGVVSAAASATSKFISSIILYACSRVTMGYSASLSLGLAALFLSESSPKECRGSIGMITGTCVQFGTVLGSILAMPQIFGTTQLWYNVYIAEILMMITLFVFLPILPETPGFLAQRGAHDAAKKSLMFYYKCSDEAAEGHLTHIKEDQKQFSKSYTMIAVIRKRSLRKKAMIGIVVTFAMSFSGVSVINAFAVEILRNTGLTSLQASLANVGIAFVSMVAIVISSMVVDKFGRRPLLLISFTGCLICNILIFSLMLTFNIYGVKTNAITFSLSVVVFATTPNLFPVLSMYKTLGFILISVICLFIIFFAIGPGPLCYFINAELVGQSARSGAQSWASVVQMLSRFLIVTIFLPMRDSLGESWSYLILFVAPVLLSIIFLYFNLPETKNKTASEVDDEISKLPTILTIKKKYEKSKVSP